MINSDQNVYYYHKNVKEWHPNNSSNIIFITIIIIFIIIAVGSHSDSHNCEDRTGVVVW